MSPQIGSNSGRDLWDIIWSCLVTISLCTWVAIHPDVPDIGRPHSRWFLIRIRILYTIAAILVPETVIFTASHQWRNARRVYKRWEKQGWTLTHGFFLEMGGFYLYEHGKPSYALSRKDFEPLVSQGLIDLPTVTLAEIDDRSKSDVLGKSLVVLQTTWFVVQCLARGVRGLFVTELELFTLAFATLNGLVYFFWWAKPVDVRCSMPVHLKIGQQKSSMRLSLDSISSPLRHNILPSMPQMQRSSESEAPISQDFRSPQTPTTPQIALTIDSQRQRNYESMAPPDIFGGRDKLILGLRGLGEPESLGSVEEVPLIKSPSMKSSFRSYSLTELDSSTQPSLNTNDSPRSLRPALGILAVSTLFGAIHCIAWFFPFPSSTERVLWRIASTIITSEPLLVLAIFFFLNMTGQMNRKSPWVMIGRMASRPGYSRFLPLVAAMMIYVVARLTLLVLAILSLRALPPVAYEDIQWLRFIPHL